MFVRGGVRGRGLARPTLAGFEDDARRAGADWMILETGRPQVAAIAFYRAEGYRDIELRLLRQLAAEREPGQPLA